MPRYIDAEAMIRKICGMKCGCERYECGYDEAGCPKVRDLENAPTVSPDEVRGVGKWEQKEIFGVKETTIEQMQSACCSVCGKYHTTPYSYYFSKYNYCPNCGARLTGGEND